MKEKMKPVIVALALTLGLFLLFPILAGAQEGMPCTPDPVDMFIGYGNLITCSIDSPGIVDIYRFNGTAGQRIEIVASSGVTNPCIELVGVGAACSFNVNRNWIDTVLTKTQEYTIRVYDYSSSGTGSYELDLESVVPPSPNGRQIAYDSYFSDQLNPAGDFDVSYFTAGVGDVVDILAASQTTNPCIAVYAPDAKTVWGACSFNVHSNEIRTSALALAGTYTILVYDYSPNGSGTYSVDLECLGGPCVVTPIPDVSGFVTLRGAPMGGRGVSLVQAGEQLQLTKTDSNGYYQFQHVAAGKTFNLFIYGQALSEDFSTLHSADAASADTAADRR